MMGADMLMDAYEHTLNETLLEEYLPLAKLTIDFFRQHYRNRTTEALAHSVRSPFIRQEP